VRVLGRALQQQGEPIPTPWPEIPIKPGPGDVVLVTAGPGVGKSFYGLNWAIDLAQKGMPALVISTDTDLSDQAVRASALLSGKPISEIEQDTAYWGKWLHDQTSLPIRWSALDITVDEFSEFIQAEIEFLGEAPVLVVVDVLTDMLGGEENVGEIRHIVKGLKRVAKKVRTTVVVLHHIKRGRAATGTSRVTLQDGLYGGEQDAPFVLGLWKPNGAAETMTVAILKNRRGPMNPDGFMTVDLRADLSHARISSRRARFA
jgi:replicative DNA helicase